MALAGLLAIAWARSSEATQPGGSNTTPALAHNAVAGGAIVAPHPPASSSAVTASAPLRFSESLALKARIGRRPGQVGFTLARDAKRLAPMGFAVLPEERILILDQENQRLQFFKAGKFERVLPLDVTTYSDIVRFSRDRIALLDRQRAGTLLLLAYDGTVERRLGLVGQGLTEAGAVDGLMVRSDGLWVQTPPNLIRFLMADGSEDSSRKLVRGPTTCDGSEIIDVSEKKGLLLLTRRNHAGVVRVSAEHSLPAKATFSGRSETDRAGNLYVGVSVRGARNESRQMLFVFDADLEKLGEIALDNAESQGAVSHRQLVIDDNGDVYWMNWTRSEIKIWRYRAIHS